MIDSIRLQKFRSYGDASFEFEKGVNIIVGANASGKTNLLEAILVLASGKSFRAKDAELIKFSAPWARLDGFFGPHEHTVKLVLHGDKAQKDFVADGKPFRRMVLDKTIPTVLFEPSHLQLVSRGPDFRRDYFDDILGRTQPGFKSLSANYRRALSQRNALLKQAPSAAKKQLFAWNVRLSELGAQIVQKRVELANAVNITAPKSYGKIANKRSKVELIYESPLDTANYSSRLLAKLEATESADFERGFTSYGPHREDFILYLNKQPAQASASRGEVRSLLIALKIFELGLIEKQRGGRPIFLLDDVFSELDGARRSHLVDYLKDHQTIITTTEADSVLSHFSGEQRIIPLSWSTTSPA
jgi:DNA replication and repair protein RecF